MGDRKPGWDKDKFTCPHKDCQVYAKQESFFITTSPDPKATLSQLTSQTPYPNNNSLIEAKQEYNLKKCELCGDISIWMITKDVKDDRVSRTPKMIYPKESSIEKASSDMPDQLKKLYDEARCVFADSPRAACILSRLCLEKLCKELGAKSHTLEKMIEEIDPKIMTDDEKDIASIIRTIGNKTIHVLLEDPLPNEHILIIFQLMNIIVSNTITRKRSIEKLRNSIPKN